MKIKFDQHFLESKHVLLLEKKSAMINNNDIIFEIGPGDGRLSHFILEDKPKKLISVEMDSNLKYNLEKLKERHGDRFEYIIGNGLEIMDKIDFNKLISNIPYSITEPLYYKIMDMRIPFVILLHGTNFFNLINDKETKWNYLINAFYNVEKILDVAGNAFNPPTKTMSVLIKLELKKENELTKKEKLIQIIYSKRDRKLLNTLIYSLVDLGKTKRESKEIIKELIIKLKNKSINKKSNKSIFESKLINLSNENFIEIIEFLNSKLYF